MLANRLRCLLFFFRIILWLCFSKTESFVRLSVVVIFYQMNEIWKKILSKILQTSCIFHSKKNSHRHSPQGHVVSWQSPPKWLRKMRLPVNENEKHNKINKEIPKGGFLGRGPSSRSKGRFSERGAQLAQRADFQEGGPQLAWRADFRKAAPQLARRADFRKGRAQLVQRADFRKGGLNYSIFSLTYYFFQ